MKEYPKVVTAEIAEKSSHVTDAEIQQDIVDTEREIEQYRYLEKADQDVARNHPNDAERKLAIFRANARPYQIQQRENFLEFVRALLAYRKENPS